MPDSWPTVEESASIQFTTVISDLLKSRAKIMYSGLQFSSINHTVSLVVIWTSSEGGGSVSTGGLRA